MLLQTDQINDVVCKWKDVEEGVTTTVFPIQNWREVYVGKKQAMLQSILHQVLRLAMAVMSGMLNP